MNYENRLNYVIDTNILVDYPDIIPSDEKASELNEPTIDLSEAHIIIPTAVIRELSSFKREKSERGKVARVILKKLRDLFELKELTVENMKPMLTSAYNMETSVDVEKQTFSILPIHKAFKRSLAFAPAEDDMDGQIILAAIAAEFIYQMLPVDGTADPDEVARIVPTGSIVLLTNDNGLAIRANRRGVITSRYGYKPPAPYTGRRELLVPNDLLVYFYDNHEIEQDIWDIFMGDEQEFDFVANEFIIMRTAEDFSGDLDECDKDPYFRHIGRYEAKSNSIVSLQYLSSFPGQIMNNGQAIYAEALMNPNFAAVICTGPAGSGKTYMATVYGYQACKVGRYIGVTVVPCASQSRIGALPGDLNEKMDPDVQPLKNALRNFLLKTDKASRAELKDLQLHGAKVPKPKCNPDTSDDDSEEDERSINQKLRDKVSAIWDAWFTNLPIENARGRDFSYEVAIYDEFQDQNATQADTLIKRLGTDGKIIITGDTEQIHAPYLDAGNNGLVYATQLLYDNPMVAQVHFTENEVVRHPLVKMVVERQKLNKTIRHLI
ncbi:MAG: PhoH family protein [Candidatus Saccharibacteria bacterium]|nr:PhoH family protein [Candidatus Saccharibacteria bacterium]